MLLTLLGSLLGGVFRLAPEVLKFLNKKDDLKHELALQDKAYEFEKLRGAEKMAEIAAESQNSWNIGALTSLQEGIKSQGTLTGVKFIDGLSASVRPILTYSFFLLFALAKVAIFVMCIQSGSNWQNSILRIWNPEDMALFSCIMNFWFIGRIFDKVK